LTALRKSTKSLKLITLDTGPKSDVTDWLNAGHSIEELLKLVQQTDEWEPKSAHPPAPKFPDLNKNCFRDWDSDEFDFHRRVREKRIEVFELKDLTAIKKLLLVMVLESPQLTQKDLGLLLGITGQHVNNIVKSLVRSGLLRVQKNGRRLSYQVLGFDSARRIAYLQLSFKDRRGRS
jgi:hypothetical protein